MRLVRTKISAVIVDTKIFASSNDRKYMSTISRNRFDLFTTYTGIGKTHFRILTFLRMFNLISSGYRT